MGTACLVVGCALAAQRAPTSGQPTLKTGSAAPPYNPPAANRVANPVSMWMRPYGRSTYHETPLSHHAQTYDPPAQRGSGARVSGHHRLRRLQPDHQRGEIPAQIGRAH